MGSLRGYAHDAKGGLEVGSNVGDCRGRVRGQTDHTRCELEVQPAALARTPVRVPGAAGCALRWASSCEMEKGSSSYLDGSRYARLR